MVDGDVDGGVIEMDVEGVAGEGEDHTILGGADLVDEFVEEGAEFCRAYSARVVFVAHTIDVSRLKTEKTAVISRRETSTVVTSAEEHIVWI